MAEVLVPLWSDDPDTPTVARLFGWSRMVARRSVQEWWLPYEREGRRWMARWDDIAAYIAAHEAGAVREQTRVLSRRVEEAEVRAHVFEKQLLRCQRLARKEEVQRG